MKSAFKAIAVIVLATSSLVSVARAADSIVGTWRLVSWTEEETENKTVHKNFGDHPSGLITFTSDGRMMSMFVDPARKPEGDGCRSCRALPDDGGLCRQVPYRGR